MWHRLSSVIEEVQRGDNISVSYLHLLGSCMMHVQGSTLAFFQGWLGTSEDFHEYQETEVYKIFATLQWCERKMSP